LPPVWLSRPAAPLPATPALGPTSLTHLERVLPAQVRDLSAAAQAPESAEGHPALAGLQSIMPPDGPVPAPAPATFEPADPAHLDLLWPVETRTVSSAWGPRMRSRTIKVKAARRKIKYRGSHKGVDLTAPKGTDVFAAMDGQVIVASRQKGYGNYVMLDHGNGVVTLYGHHNRNFVKDGEIVRRGQKIAEVCDLAIITTKDRFGDIKKGAFGAGMKKENILFCEKPRSIDKLIKKRLVSGDTVLLEGRSSQNIINLFK